MDQSIRISEFAQQLFEQMRIAEQAATIMEGIRQSRSGRLSAIAQHMPGQSDANYRAIRVAYCNHTSSRLTRRI